MVKTKKISKVFILLLLTTVFVACSTKRNSWINRNYHELTSYYNIYWNGDVTYKEVLAKVEESDHDDYSKVLTVYQFGLVSDTTSTATMTNRMLEKATKVIAKHSMLIKGEEHVKTVKKAYFMLGIAYLYKHDYSTARTFFNYASTNFSKSPLKYDALLWSVKVYLADEEYDMAVTLLAQIQNNENVLSKATKRRLPLVYADYFIRQKKYNEALPYLKKGLDLAKSKDLKNRLTFILAQIEQENGRSNEAFALYKKILKSNPKLKLDFNSRLNLALCYDSKVNNSKEIIKDVEKLLKDKKHEKYFGRIYYILSEIKLKDGNTEEAIDYLEKSVVASAIDKPQLIISARKMADICFNGRKYIQAEEYYKKLFENITEAYPDYELVKIRANNLAKLVQYADIVAYEELMQELAVLPAGKRDKKIDSLIVAYQKEEALRQEKLSVAPSGNAQSSSSGNSSWYFYNEQAKSLGYREFSQKWGQRANEDLWFLTNKPNLGNFFSSSSEEYEDDAADSTSHKNYSKGDREYYLMNMTDTPEKKVKSDINLEKNKFLLGINYFNLVDEAKLGIEALEELLKHYPNTDYKLQAYHYLYRMYAAIGDNFHSEKYKNLIINEFPNSEQAKQVADPEYDKKQKATKLDAENLYDYTFEAYSIGAYDVVLTNVAEAEARYSGNVYLPKFRFLEAMASGNVKGIDTMMNKLQKFVSDFPEESSLTARANEILGNLTKQKQEELTKNEENKEVGDDGNTLENNSTVKVDFSMYEYAKDAKYYCIIVLKEKQNRVDFVKLRITDFNRLQFPKLKLTVHSERFSQEEFLVYLSEFQDEKQAKEYATELQNSNYVFGTISSEKKIYFISIENFNTLKNLKNVDVYDAFYKEKY
ncbi:MAG: tetratricopeptide repeat protein [Bacteroidales bacterium]|nr:tetratricopeptide repeat protein [Bacteroidales bacterium]